MNTEDKKEFHAIVTGMFTATGRGVPQKDAVKIWWNCFKNDSMADVRSAFGQAIAESTEFLVPGQVRKYIPDRSGYLDPETAWNHVPKTEANAGWVYPELLQAVALAQDSIDRGDMIAGRVAFIEAYKRLTGDVKAQQRKPTWFYCEASHVTREERLSMKLAQTTLAMDRKWIPEQIGRNILMQLDAPQINPAMKNLADQVNATKRIGDISSKTPE